MAVNEDTMKKLKYIVDNSYMNDKYRCNGNEHLTPICLALLCRLSNKCENIKFSRDISKSVTKEFDLKLPDSIPNNSSEFMANLVKYLEGVLVDFFKDKKATLHYCNMDYDATNRYCTLMVDYTEE